MNSNIIKDGFGREVQVNLSNDQSAFGGLVPMVHKLRKNGFMSSLFEALVPFLPNDRQAKKVRYSSAYLLKQRLLGLLIGHEDLNDSPTLAQDRGFIAAFGKDAIASTSTLCRFEREISQKLIDKGNDFLLECYFRYAPNRRYIFIDVDNTPVELYGHQENVKFNGHYGCNCYLPLLAFIDGYPIGVYNGNIDGRKELTKHFSELVKKIQKRRPHSIIILRADSGFNSTELIDTAEELGCYYLIGLSPNKRLIAQFEKWNPDFVDVLHRCPEHGGNVLRHYGEIEDYQAQSWNGPRRVIARDYFSDERRQWDPRFIQTNIPREKDKRCGKLWQYSARDLYESLYCNRGLAEQHNQSFKYQAFGARSSSTRFLTNSYRMLLGALCQLCYRIIQQTVFRSSQHWYSATIWSFRDKFIRIPATIVELTRKVKITINPGLLSAEMNQFWSGAERIR